MLMNQRKIIPGTGCPFLEFKNLTVTKGDGKTLLDRLTLTINDGENVAILGPNGAGKSSLIKTITREYYPVTGQGGVLCRIWGQERWNVFDLRFLMGIVSNDLQYTFTRRITGEEVVLSGFFSSVGLYKEPITLQMRKKAGAVIEFLGLAHLKNRMITEMSSGEARRFMIGRALVHDPKVLILDEPTNSLDPHALYKAGDLLRKIARSGVSVVLVTQNLYDVFPEIGRVILMKDGKLLKDGDKERILNAQNLSGLFDIPVKIVSQDGYYYWLRG